MGHVYGEEGRNQRGIQMLGFRWTLQIDMMEIIVSCNPKDLGHEREPEEMNERNRIG